MPPGTSLRSFQSLWTQHAQESGVQMARARRPSTALHTGSLDLWVLLLDSSWLQKVYDSLKCVKTCFRISNMTHSFCGLQEVTVWTSTVP